MRRVLGARSAANGLLLGLGGLAVIALFAAVAAARVGYLKVKKFRKVVSIGVWVVFGNLASMSGLERAIFTPVSVVLSLLALRLAIEKQTKVFCFSRPAPACAR